MKHRLLKLFTLLITLSFPFACHAQTQDYPKVLDIFVYPLGYDKNVFDTPFDDFERYLNANYKGQKAYGGVFPGLNNVEVSVDIMGIKFNWCNVVFFENTRGSFVLYKNYGHHSLTEHNNLINGLVNSGLKKISSESSAAQNGHSSILTEFRYNNVFEVTVNYLVDDGGGIEISCHKESIDKNTGIPKQKVSSASASSTKSYSNNLQEILIGKWFIVTEFLYQLHEDYKRVENDPVPLPELVINITSEPMDTYHFFSDGTCHCALYVDGKCYDLNLKWEIVNNSTIHIKKGNGNVIQTLKISESSDKVLHVISQVATDDKENLVLIKE